LEVEETIVEDLNDIKDTIDVPLIQDW